MAGTVATSSKTIIEQLEERKTMLSVPEVATLLNEHVDTIYRRVKRGKMPHIKIGFNAKFDPRELAAWLRERHVGKAS
jgi:excisionase family DNA binding protein